VNELKAMIMLRKAADPLSRHHQITRSALARGCAAGLVLVLGVALAGCAQRAAASGSTMVLATAYIGQPQGSDTTDAYLVIRNNGPADKLISARTSVGGTVVLRGPVAGDPDEMHNVAAIAVPADSLTRLDPNGYHLFVSGTRPMKSGTDITITLVFAKAGKFQIAAAVTNPQTGGSSYFLN
jgi:copper(I)-binding protein